MKVYISGALQGSANLAAAREVYEFAGHVVQDAGGVAYVPHTKTDPQQNNSLNGQSVFRADFDEIRSSDGLVVFLNEPSLGVGAEIVIALSMGKSILPLAYSKTSYSRFVEGLLEEYGMSVARYYSNDDLQGLISDFVLMNSDRNKVDHLACSL